MQVAQSLPSFNFKANSVSKKHKSFLTVSELLGHSQQHSVLRAY